MSKKLLIVRWVPRGQSEGHFSEHLKTLIKAAQIFEEFRLLNLNKDNFPQSFLDLSDNMLDFSPDHVHFEWFHDFEKYAITIDKLLTSFQTTWTAVASINHAARYGHNDSNLSQTMISLSGSKSLKGFMTWDLWIDTFKPKNYPTFFTMRDYQEIDYVEDQVDCCSFKFQKKPIIGVVGQLYGYRGSEKLIKYWIKRRTFNLYLAGRYFRSSHSRFVQLAVLLLKNFKIGFFKLSWISDSKMLNHHIRHLDALYIDSKSYPQPSGICIRARQLNIPIIIEDADSYLRDMSHQDKGIIIIDLSECNKKELALEIKRAKSFETNYKFNETDLINDIRAAWLKNV